MFFSSDRAFKPKSSSICMPKKKKHEGSFSWCLIMWGWVKTLVPSKPLKIAGIYGCSSHYSNGIYRYWPIPMFHHLSCRHSPSVHRPGHRIGVRGIWGIRASTWGVKAWKNRETWWNMGDFSCVTNKMMFFWCLKIMNLQNSTAKIRWCHGMLVGG